MTGPGVVSFWWKVSSKWDDDLLHFILDGESRLAISGEVDWELRAYAVPAGAHTLRWAYCKNDEDSRGLDAAWLDQVRFTTDPPSAPRIVTHPRSQAVPAEESVLFNVAAQGVEPFQYQWRRNGIPLAGETSAALLISSVQPESAGDYSADVHGPGGTVTSAAGRLTVLPAPASWTWVRQGFATNETFATCAATDPAGNVYVAGRFNQDVLQFGPYTLVNPSNGWALFLVKFAPNGTVLWAQQSRGLAGFPSIEVQSLAVDAAGNAYVAGDLFGTVALGSHTITARHVDSFVAKFSDSGEALWAQAIGGSDYDSRAAVGLDALGNVYVLGHFMRTLQLGGHTLTSAGAQDFYLAKLDGGGQVLWAIQGGSAGYDGVAAPAVDAAGNVYVLGQMEQGGAFGGQSLPSGQLLVKCSPDGQVLWSLTDPDLPYFGRSRPTVDAAGNIYLPGVVNRPSRLGANILMPTNQDDFLLAKLNTDGQVLWVRQTAFADRRAGFNGPITVALDSTGHIYVCGYPFGLVDFAGHAFSCDYATALVLKFDASGGFLWGKKTARFGWTPENALALGSAGQVYLAGSFYGTVSYGTNTLTTPRLDALVLRLDENPIPSSFVQRQLSQFYQTLGAAHEVTLLCQPATGTSVYAVEDRPPADWQVTEVSAGGVWDAQTGKVKFGPFFDAEARFLSYAVIPPAGATGVQCFEGVGSADGLDSPVTGPACMVPLAEHPADTLAPLFSLSIGEVTAYGAAWRRGQDWPLPPNPIPIDYVTRAAALWKGGECYTLDGWETNAPLWWISCPGSTAGMAMPAAPASQTSVGTAIRRLPEFAGPTEPVTVTLELAPSPLTKACAVEEVIPSSVAVANITGNGEWDAASRKIKWGPFLDATSHTVSYQASRAERGR